MKNELNRNYAQKFSAVNIYCKETGNMVVSKMGNLKRQLHIRDDRMKQLKKFNYLIIAVVWLCLSHDINIYVGIVFSPFAGISDGIWKPYAAETKYPNLSTVPTRHKRNKGH